MDIEKPQATLKDLEVAKENASAATPKEGLVSSESATSELLPSIQSGGIDIQSHHSLDFFDFLVRGKQKAVASPPVEDSSVDDFLNSLGCSTEFDIAACPESSRSSVGFGTFFDEVASFSNLDDNGLNPYGSVFAADF